MDRVVGEAVGRDVLEVEPGVAAQDIEEVAGRAEVQDQAGAPEGEGGSGAAGLGIGALVPAVELRAHDVVEEVPQPTAAADLGVQVEDLVVTRERSERAELELVGALCDEAGESAREGDSEHRECSQGTVTPLGLALREHLGLGFETPEAGLVTWVHSA